MNQTDWQYKQDVHFDAERFNKWEAPNDEFKYAWFNKWNKGKAGWQDCDCTIGDLHLHRMPLVEWRKVKIADEVSRIKSTFKQLKNTWLATGNGATPEEGEFTITIDADIYNDVMKKLGEMPDFLHSNVYVKSSSTLTKGH